MPIETIGTPWMWVGFLAFVLAMLALDLGVFHRHSHEVKPREALGWTVVWVVLALLFNLGVWAWFGPDRALEFTTGYVLEKSLAVDNIFVFVVIFAAFAVPAAWQHRVLFWGVLGALVFRAVFIGLGAALLQRFHWVLYVFGGILLITAVKLLREAPGEIHPERNRLFRWFRRVVPSVSDYRGDRFLVREGGRWLATPLLAVLVLIEFSDIVFAVDSIPAIFAVTEDPFIVFTSNVFAILGLRSMYFLLAGVVHRFHYLRLGLAATLAFVGAKLLVSGVYKVPILASLAVVVVLIGGSMAASLLWPREEEKRDQQPPREEGTMGKPMR